MIDLEESFRVEKLNGGSVKEYALNIGINGISRRFYFTSKSQFFIRSGDIMDIDERPPTPERFREMIGDSIPFCPAEVFIAFRAYTCGVSN
jgi:hypothetical protein